MKIYDKKGTKFNFTFKVDKFLDGNPSGFTLKGVGQKEKHFCSTFLQALENGQGEIKISNHGLWLLNGLYTDVYLPLNEQEIRFFYQFYQTGKKIQLILFNNPKGFSVLHET